VVLLVVVLGWASPAPAQVPPTTAPSVLVPGPTTTVAPTGATTAPTTSAPAADGGDGGGLLDFDFDANTKVWIIVGGLVVVAIATLVLTILYWRHTRPERAEDDGGEAEPKRTRRQRRRDERAASEAEAATAAEVPDLSEADLDELLGPPDAQRSVFADLPEEPEEPASTD